MQLLSREMKQLRVEVDAFSEVRRPVNSTINVGGCISYWSGRSDGHHLQEVAIATFSILQSSVVKVTLVFEHITVPRLKLTFGLSL